MPTGDVGAVPSDPFGGGPPPDYTGVPQGSAITNGGSDVSESWTIALIASSNVVVAWLLLVVLLCEVSLVRGKTPRLSNNVQVAVWASVPLGLMAALQIIYYAAGGRVGEPGLAGLLPEWDRYADFSRGQRSLLLSAATRTTLFSLWTLALVYTGARQTLKGQRWAALLAVLIWAVLIIAIPPVMGTITSPEDEFAVLPAEFMPDNGALDGVGEGELLPPDISGESDAIQQGAMGESSEDTVPTPDSHNAEYES